jgi:hypothetical protein
MYNDCVKYGIVYQERPPYEVLYTKWLSYEDIIYLKKIEQMVENYYNSRLYINTMEYFVNGNSAFGIFEYLCRYYEENDLFMCSHSRISRYEILYRCIIKWIGENLRGSAVNDAESLVRDLMVFDLYLREKLRTRPYFANEYNEFKDIQKYICLNAEIPKTAHIERFKKNILGHIVREIKIKKLSVLKQMKDNYDDWLYMVFDYEKADPLEHAAEVYEVVFE